MPPSDSQPTTARAPKRRDKGAQMRADGVASALCDDMMKIEDMNTTIVDYRRAVVAWLRRKESKWRRTASAGFGAASGAASFYAAAYHNAADGIERGEPERKMENNG